MIRVIALIIAFFLFFASLESWAGFWFAGRWFVSSRVASLTLGVVRGWLNRGLISGTTQTVKVFVQRNGKWILLTLALPDVIREVRDLEASSSYCYINDPSRTISAGWTPWGTLTVQSGGNHSSSFYSVSYPQACYSGSTYLPAVRIWKWQGSSWSTDWAFVPRPGTYTIGACQVVITLKVSSVCPSSSTTPPSVDWDQRREVPVRVYPNPSDFVRPDVIENDHSLRWLRDEYQRIAQDTSIPTIGDLSGVVLPSVGWAIPPEEALDSASEEGSTSSSSSSGSSSGSTSGSGSGSGSGERENNPDFPAVPGFDTSLPSLEKRPFPVELINSLVQNHPFLRILQQVNFDVDGSGSCEIGSGVFTINFCSYAWVFNLMGAIIVPVAFLYGLFGWRND